MKCYCTPQAVSRPVMRVARVAAIILTLALAAHPVFQTVTATQSAAAESWTIMVYMADDFEMPLNWQDDINEMEAAVQRAGTTIIALVDDYGPDNTVVLKVEHDPNFLDPTIVSTYIDQEGAIYPGSEADMASADTLRAFIEFAAGKYPAERYVLVLWGHGAGWPGVCPDGHDLLNLTELKSALDGAVDAVVSVVDLLVVDSCALATVELLAQRLPVSVVVASEKDVPYAGLPYTLVLDRLATKPDMTPAEFGREIADTYVSWSMTNTDYSTTMAVLEGRGLALTRLLHQLTNVSELGKALDPAYHSELVQALDSAEEYERPYSVDFGDYMRKIMTADVPLELKYAAYRALVALDEVVIHFARYDNPYASDGVRATNASGLAIYAVSSAPYESEYFTLRICETRWEAFAVELRNATYQIPLGPGPDIQISEGEGGNQIATVSWGPEFDKVRIWVFQSTPEGLSYIGCEDSTTGTVIIDGYLGYLKLSAAAFLGGIVRAHSTHDVTLIGSVSVNIDVRLGGERISGGVDVRLLLNNGSVEAARNSDGLFSARVTVPTEAYVGQLVIIEVRDSRTHELLGESMVRITSGGASVSVELLKSPEGWGPTLAGLAFALLPALLILVFAVLLHRERRRGSGSS